MKIKTKALFNLGFLPALLLGIAAPLSLNAMEHGAPGGPSILGADEPPAYSAAAIHDLNQNDERPFARIDEAGEDEVKVAASFQEIKAPAVGSPK